MAPLYLPRVGAFPIFAENHPVTVMATSTQLPLTVKKDFPLKDKPAPDFILSDQLGRLCSLHATIRLGRPIILFFFPLAGSPHCTAESCLFRDAIALTPIFSDLQAIVIGISQDPPQRAKRFVEEHRLGYRILYDEKRRVMEAFGVGRTTFGLVDNRATFIIDPSGIVRGLAEGVLNSRGHLKFAEQWLIRLEHELSERSRELSELITRDGDMIAHMEGESERMVQVVYGKEGSAEHGGIGGAPRYGQAIGPVTKLPYSPLLRRSSSEEKLSSFRQAKDLKREMTADGLDGKPEKNIWKNWKYMLSQLSSPDDKPPPIAESHSRSGEMTQASISPAESIKSGKSSRSNASRLLSRRSKSAFGSKRNPVGNLDSTAVGDAAERSLPPPIPKARLRSRLQGNGFSRGRMASDDEESEGFRTAGTDTSLESTNRSTAPSSFDHQGHTRGMSSSNSNGHAVGSPSMLAAASSDSVSGAKWQAGSQFAKPSVTSEVLMAEEPYVSRSPVAKGRTPNSPFDGQAHRSESDNGLQPPRRSVGPTDVPEDANPEDEEVVGNSPLGRLQSLPNLLSQAIPPSPGSTLEKSTPPSRADSSSGARSGTPTSMSSRRGKRMPPPVVVSQYQSSQWKPGTRDDSFAKAEMMAYPSSSGGSSNPYSATSSGNTPGSSLPRSAGDKHTPTSIEAVRLRNSVDMGKAVYSSSEGQRSRASSIIAARQRNGSVPNDAFRSMPSPFKAGQGPSNSWVLQSLSTSGGNASQHSLHSASGSSSSNHHHVESSPLVRTNTDGSGRAKLIPRKAPPPMHALPPVPPQEQAAHSPPQSYSHHQQQQHSRQASVASSLSYDPERRPSATSIASGLTKSASVMESPLFAATNEAGAHSPVDSYQSATHFLPSSRRPSASDSIDSAGTFG